jgi:AcrR family transcriptional regulator
VTTPPSPLPTGARVPRRRLTVDAIVEAALEVIDDAGVDNLTTINVARRLGVSQPALYSHVSGLDELREAVAARGARELSERVRHAVMGKVEDDALFAMAHAYRGYVSRHPDRYLVQLRSAGSDGTLAAMERSAEAVRAVLRSYGLSDEQVLEAHVAFRAAVHGFVHLEARGALSARPLPAAEHFDFFVRLFAAGLRTLAVSRRAAQ